VKSGKHLLFWDQSHVISKKNLPKLVLIIHFSPSPGDVFGDFLGIPGGSPPRLGVPQRDPALRMRQPCPQALLNFHQLQHAHPAACGKSWEKYPRNP